MGAATVPCKFLHVLTCFYREQHTSVLIRELVPEVILHFLQAQLERILEGESRQLPWQHIATLVGLTLGGRYLECRMPDMHIILALHCTLACIHARLWHVTKQDRTTDRKMHDGDPSSQLQPPPAAARPRNTKPAAAPHMGLLSSLVDDMTFFSAAVIAIDSAKAYVSCGGAAYWAIALSLVPLTAVVSAAAATWLTRKHNLKEAAGRSLRKGEVAPKAENPLDTAVLVPESC